MPTDIVTSGTVGRAIFQSSDWRKIRRGNTPPAIFLNRQNVSPISVFILGAVPDKQLTTVGDSLAKKRGADRKFYGWAELPATDASKDGREIHATPQPDNEWHADIVLPPVVEKDKRERERHLYELANMSTPRRAER